MAHYSANAVTNAVAWFLWVPTTHRDHLGTIRHWPTLRMAFADDGVWVSGFDAAQIASVSVQRIPEKRVYYSNGDNLCRPRSLLPERPVPALLWSPMERGLPVTLPPFNGNYTAEQPLVSVQLVPAAPTERESVALLVQLPDLARYVETAPAIRLQALRWVLLNTDRALLVGTPGLPVPGAPFWQRGDFLLPAGYDLDLYVLAELLNDTVNPDGRHWVVWQPDATYFLVPKNAGQPLSLRSFRASTTG